MKLQTSISDDFDNLQLGSPTRRASLEVVVIESTYVKARIGVLFMKDYYIDLLTD